MVFEKSTTNENRRCVDLPPASRIGKPTRVQPLTKEAADGITVVNAANRFGKQMTYAEDLDALS